MPDPHPRGPAGATRRAGSRRGVPRRVARLRLLVAGVGGQGCITAARTIGEAAVDAGLDARVGELHGLAQRGGSVESTIVLGPGRTAILEPGRADVLVALEPLEALRAAPRLAPHGVVILSPRRIVPFAMTHAGRTYPGIEEILDVLRRAAGDVIVIDAPALAHRAGEPRAANVALLGALAGLGILPFAAEVLERAVARRSPARFREANAEAFRLGREGVMSGERG